MIFSPELARAVERRAKTQTRRPIKRQRINGALVDVACRYKVGHTYAVQPGRGVAGICHITITDRRRELAGEITAEDAKAEGFKDVAEFAKRWLELYERSSTSWPPSREVDCPDCDEEAVIWDPDTESWVECPRCDTGIITVPREPTPGEALDRFLSHHGHTRVWVLEFEKAQDLYLASGSPLAPEGKARLLSPRKVQPRPHAPEPQLTEEEARGYTTSPSRALPGERRAPVVDPGELSPRWEMRAGKKHTTAVSESVKQAREARELLDAEERVRRAYQAARANHRDVRDEVKALRRMKRMGRPEEKQIAQVRQIERVAYREAA